MKTSSPRDHAKPDERDIDEMRASAPQFTMTRSRRFAYWFEDHGLAPNWAMDRMCYRTCGYCGRKAKTRSMAVSPITLRRSLVDLCNRKGCLQKLRAWEGQSDSRRRRAQFDWERQHPEAAALALIGYIPPQYPSVSRATLRAFLDSGADVATVDGSDATTLNGSIKRLGFGDAVFAERRSDLVVLRRCDVQEDTK